MRRDYDANSPMQTVDRGAFEQQNSIGLETALNELPQFVPAAQGVTQLQDQSQMTDNFTTLTAGASTISLRGLGANRNLVLLDGYRAVPVNATMAVDVNSIPAAAIERVEVITGGASSVYGADAVAGVVNFILKKDFEGLDLDIQSGAMQNGAGAESRASALFGVTSGDGSGNIMLGIELAKRDAIHADDTDFWHDALRDGTTYPTQLIYTGPYYTVDTANAPSRRPINGIFNQAAGTSAEHRRERRSRRRRQRLLERRRLALHGRRVVQQQSRRRAVAIGAYRYNGPTYTSRENANPGGRLSVPLHQHRGRCSFSTSCRSRPTFRSNRSSIFGRATYDMSDNISAYAQVMSVTSKTRRYFTDSPAIGGWGMIAPHGTDLYSPSLGANNATLPAYLPGGQYGLNCATTGGCTKSQAFPVSPGAWARCSTRAPNPERGLELQLRHGLRRLRRAGQPVPLDLQRDAHEPGVVRLEGQRRRDRRHVGRDRVEGYGEARPAPRGLRFAGAHPNAHRPRRTGARASSSKATPRLRATASRVVSHSARAACRSSRARTVRISQDCIDAMYVTLNHQSEMEQKFIEGNLQGHAFDMPAGEARFSAGMHSRTNSYYYIFDPLQTSNAFNDNPQGFPADNTRGETGVDEIYGELLLPLLDGKPGAEHLNLELGYRYSDYELQGGIDTYKALVDWGITRHAAVPRRPSARDARAEHRGAVPGEDAVVVGPGAGRAVRAEQPGDLRRESGEEPERRGRAEPLSLDHWRGGCRVLHAVPAGPDQRNRLVAVRRRDGYPDGRTRRKRRR